MNLIDDGSDNVPQDIVAVLTHYGADVLSARSRSYGWYSVKCCFHDDTRASARVSEEVGAFCCLACGMKGDAIGIIMKKEGVDYVGAIALYEGISGGKTPGVSRPVREVGGGWDVLGEPRPYEGKGGISRWLKRAP